MTMMTMMKQLKLSKKTLIVLTQLEIELLALFLEQHLLQALQMMMMMMTKKKMMMMRFKNYLTLMIHQKLQ
jgi:hypothetical protein